MTELEPQSQTSTAHRIEELGRIIMAYSEITDKLQQSHERLETTVRALREELSEKNQLLERRNRLAAVGEMAAGMAHEIRNPLGGIQLYASMLATDVKDRPESAKLVAKISGGVKHLEGLVGQVLHFTREMRPFMARMDLRETVEQAVDLARGVLERQSVSCQVIGPETLAVDADPRLLSQAVVNLLVNGAEATPVGGSVTVRIGLPEAGEARQFVMIVQDSGSGLPAGVMEKIFDPFFTTKETGTGLGLAIVHRVVEAHDGSITASNPPEGGARFEVRI